MTVDATTKVSPQCDAEDATYSTFIVIGDELEVSYSACSDISLVTLDHMDITLSEEDAITFVIQH